MKVQNEKYNQRKMSEIGSNERKYTMPHSIQKCSYKKKSLFSYSLKDNEPRFILSNSFSVYTSIWVSEWVCVFVCACECVSKNEKAKIVHGNGFYYSNLSWQCVNNGEFRSRFVEKCVSMRHTTSSWMLDTKTRCWIWPTARVWEWDNVWQWQNRDRIYIYIKNVCAK